MKFRTDINALRALAVLSVIIFHFAPHWLPGGFIGVDIFFVISGYLMTRIVLEGLEQHDFSLAGFYAARLKRIAPALLGVGIVLVLFGYVYLAPQSYENLAKHLRYALGFSSNMVFDSEAGYFDTASREKWLLHTWSLSVEWQFYLLYPLILMGVSRLTSRLALGQKPLRIAINSALTASLLWCLYMGFTSQHSPYFLLQTRAWEMLLGAWAFLYRPKWVHNSWPGWLVLVVSCIWMNESMVWPGAWTLLPTLATVWVLWAQRESAWGQFSVIQHLGRYSYSLYLWHWPVVVLSYNLGWSGTSSILLGITLSLLLGIISYYVIEQPVAKHRVFNTSVTSFRHLMKTPLLWVLVAAILGAKWIGQQDGLPQRPTLSPLVVNLYSQIDHGRSPERDKCHIKRASSILPTCHLMADSPSWATLGDSHAAELSYALAKEVNTHNDGVAQYSFSACPPSFGQTDTFSPCTQWTNKVVNEINQNPSIRHVVILYRYSLHLFGSNEVTYPELVDLKNAAHRDDILRSLDKTVDSFLQHDKEVFVVMPVPEMGRSIQSQIDRRALLGQNLETIPSVTVDYYQRRNQVILSHLQHYNTSEKLHVIPVKDIFCEAEQCFSVINQQPLYVDDDHASMPAAAKIAHRIIEQTRR